jgi:acyl-CoA thioester hydrolase
MKKIDYSYDLTVTEEDVDDLMHVNNLTYLEWVLEAANKHWTNLTNSLFDDRYAWVVLRHEIDYKNAALINDRVTVYTCIRDTYGASSERFVHILKDGKILAECKTIWCLVDRKTMRPCRVPDSILSFLSGNSIE